MSTSSAFKIGLASPLIALAVLLVGVVVSVLARASQDEEEIRSPPLYVVFPLGAAVGGAVLAATNALLALLLGVEVAIAAAAGLAAGLVSAPLLLTGLLVGFSASLSLALPFIADVAALLVASAL